MKTERSLNNEKPDFLDNTGASTPLPENYTTTPKIGEVTEEPINIHIHIPIETKDKTKHLSDSSSEASDDDIQKKYSAYKEQMVSKYYEEILSTFLNDEFIDGEISSSEIYMKDNFDKYTKGYILEALNKILLDNFGDSHIIEGVLTMISSIPYKEAYPQGVTLCVSLLSHQNFEVRDKAVQTFERWNSRSGISILERLHCSPAWFQKYIDDVITALKEEGED